MRIPAAAVAAMMLLAACGGDDPAAVDGESTTDPATESAAESADESTGDADGQWTAIGSDPPSIAPGSFTTGEVTIDATTIDYVTVVPDGFEVGDVAPVLLAMPPGGQNLALTESVVSTVYTAEAVARGWVVVSPAAPDDQLYFQGSETLIPGLLAWIETWVDPEGGKPHLAGISNGGISSFRVAAENPDGFQSIVAFPGYPRSDSDKAALERLVDIPIRLYVGETDTGWVGPMQDTFDTLTELGGDVSLDIRAGEGHVMASLGDGVDVFDQLDAAR